MLNAKYQYLSEFFVSVYDSCVFRGVMPVCTRDKSKCFLWNVDAVEVIALLIPLTRMVRLPAPASRIVKCRHPFSNPIEYGKQYVEMVGSGGRGLRIASIRWWMKMCSWSRCLRMSIPPALVLCLVVCL